jgi:hypothetical protein
MSTQADRISRSDLEGKFRALKDGTSQKATDAKASLAQVGIGVALLLLLLTFLMGQRRGKRKTTLVEIRRF